MPIVTFIVPRYWDGEGKCPYHFSVPVEVRLGVLEGQHSDMEGVFHHFQQQSYGYRPHVDVKIGTIGVICVFEGNLYLMCAVGYVEITAVQMRKWLKDAVSVPFKTCLSNVINWVIENKGLEWTTGRRRRTRKNP